MVRADGAVGNSSSELGDRIIPGVREQRVNRAIDSDGQGDIMLIGAESTGAGVRRSGVIDVGYDGVAILRNPY